MRTWITEIVAVSPIDGQTKRYGGPNVSGINAADAQNFCEQNGLGYCKVIGELVAEIPCIKGTYNPDFKNQINYDQSLN